MDHVSSMLPSGAVPRVVGLQRVRGWALWSLPRRLRAYVLVVFCADLASIGFSAATFHFQLTRLALFAGLLACSAVTVEVTRRASESTGAVKDFYMVWELPAVILVSPLCAMVAPAVRIALTQWRVRREPLHRRVFTASATGLAYGCASLVYHGMLPAGWHMRNYLWGHTGMWLLAALTCAVTQWAVSQLLVLTAAKAAEPAARIRGTAFSREMLQSDITEVCAALLLALGLMISPLTLIVALPLATLLQRAFRHDELLLQAQEDAKTGLLNASAWERQAVAEISRAVRTGTPLAVALLDLDRFKQINDTYGHLLGDQVLRQIASTMTQVLRDYDLSGRFGGEEFVVLLPQTRAVDALRIAERVRAHISQLPVYADGSAGPERVPVTVSIGVAALDTGSRRELADLLAAADAALYRAKASGRDQVQMISTSRGLSAVRPPEAGEPAAGEPVAGKPVAGKPVVGRVDEAGEAGDQAGGGTQLPDDPPPNAQLPEAGTASTATTSALAV